MCTLRTSVMHVRSRYEGSTANKFQISKDCVSTNLLRVLTFKFTRTGIFRQCMLLCATVGVNQFVLALKISLAADSVLVSTIVLRRLQVENLPVVCRPMGSCLLELSKLTYKSSAH